MITATSTSLLLGLQDPKNDSVWTEFYSRYHPLLVSFGRRLGLSEDESQETAQEILLKFAEAYRNGHYDKAKGRLRTWLSEIARNKIIDWKRRRARRPPPVQLGDAADQLVEEPDKDRIDRIMQEEWHRALVSKAMELIQQEVEPKTLRAFELFVLQDQPAEQVAAELGMTANAVFKAKRRVLSRLREIYAQLNEDY